jgi:hypothetical protein
MAANMKRFLLHPDTFIQKPRSMGLLALKEEILEIFGERGFTGSGIMRVVRFVIGVFGLHADVGDGADGHGGKEGLK